MTDWDFFGKNAADDFGKAREMYGSRLPHYIFMKFAHASAETGFSSNEQNDFNLDKFSLFANKYIKTEEEKKKAQALKKSKK